MLGCDVLDGNESQLGTFKSTTNVTYPLLLRCYGTFNDPENFVNWYGQRDNFVVISKQGVVRYRAAQTWPYGNGYHLSEIRAIVDSLLLEQVDAPPGDAPVRARLEAAPNPFREGVDIRFELPRALDSGVRVAVHDLAGRRVATLWDGAAPAGVSHARWDGRGDRGEGLPPGVYLVRAELGETRLQRRIVRVR